MPFIAILLEDTVSFIAILPPVPAVPSVFTAFSTASSLHLVTSLPLTAFCI